MAAGGVDKMVLLERAPNVNDDIPAPVLEIPIGYLDEDGAPIVTKGSALPRNVATLAEANLAFVTLQNAGGVAVVDLVSGAQIDIDTPGDPDKDTTTGFIQLGTRDENGKSSAAPFDITLDPTNRYLLVNDYFNDRVYIIDIAEGDNQYKVVHTAGRLFDYGSRHMSYTPDGTQLIFTGTRNSTFSGTGEGTILIFNMPPIREFLANLDTSSNEISTATRLFHPDRIAAQFTSLPQKHNGVEGSSTIPLRQPYDLRTVVNFDGLTYAMITDKSAHQDINGVIVLRREGTSWTLFQTFDFNLLTPGPQSISNNNVDVLFNAKRDSFDINDAAGIAISPDLKYAFVMGQNRFEQDNPTRDPHYTAGRFSDVLWQEVYQAGSSIALIKYPFGLPEDNNLPEGAEPRIAGTLRPISNAFSTGVAISGDARTLYGGYGSTGLIGGYDIDALLEVSDSYFDSTVPGLSLRPYYFALNDLRVNDGSVFGPDPYVNVRTAAVTWSSRDGINEDIDIAADYAIYREGFSTYTTRPSVEGSDNVPISASGRVENVISQAPFLGLISPVPSDGPLTDNRPTFTWNLGEEELESTFFLAVVPQGAGLFPDEVDDELFARLKDENFLWDPYQDINVAIATQDVPQDKSDTGRLLFRDGNRNRIYARKFKAPGADGNVSFRLPPGLELTRGQTYFWGVMAQDEENRRVKLSQSFTVGAAEEPTNPTSQSIDNVTVITHDFSLFHGGGPTESLTYTLGHDIATNNNGVLALHDPATGKFTSLTKGRTIGDGKGGPVVLLMDWQSESTINDAGFAEGAASAMFASLAHLDYLQSGKLFSSANWHFIGHGRGAVVNSEIVQRMFATYPAMKGNDIDVQFTTIDPFDGVDKTKNLPIKAYLDGLAAAANVGTIAAAVVSPPVALALQRVSKAAGVIGRAANALGFANIDWTDFKDPEVRIWDGIDFADNYYQNVPQEIPSYDSLLHSLTVPKIPILKELFKPNPDQFSLTVSGRALDGADINKRLTGLPGFIEDDNWPRLDFGTFGELGIGWGTAHNRALTYYGGTADLNRGTYAVAGGAPDPIWRSLYDFDRIEGPTSSLGTLSRFYSDTSPARLNPFSWYRAREFETDVTFGTVTKGAEGLRATSPKVDRSPWEGIGTGYFYSDLGGGLAERPKKKDAKRPDAAKTINTEIGDASVPIPLIYNGDFESSFRAIYGRVPFPFGDNPHGYEMAGWAFHGGSGGFLQAITDFAHYFTTDEITLSGFGDDTGKRALDTLKDTVAGVLKNILNIARSRLTGEGAQVTAKGIQEAFSAALSSGIEDLLKKDVDDLGLRNLMEVLRKSIQASRKELKDAVGDTKIAKPSWHEALGTDATKKLSIGKQMGAALLESLIPIFISYLQANFLDHKLALIGKSEYQSNRFVMPKVGTMGFTVDFDLVQGFFPGPMTLTTYFVDMNGEQTSLKPVGGGEQHWTDLSTFNGQAFRVTLEVPESIRNRAGYLKFSYAPSETASRNVLLIDDIGHGGLSISDNSVYHDDATLFFNNDLSDTSLATKNADLRLISKEFGYKLNDKNRNRFVVNNFGTAPQRFRLEAADGLADWVTIRRTSPASVGNAVSLDGVFTKNDDPVTADITFTNGTSSDVTLQGQQRIAFEITAAFPLEELKKMTASGLKSETIDVVELSAQGVEMARTTVSLHYLLDIADQNTMDGVLDMGSVREGKKTEFDLPGTDALDVALKSQTQNDGILRTGATSTWFKLDGASGGEGDAKLTFEPKKMPPDRPAIDAEAELDLNVGGKGIGSIKVKVQARKEQTLGINRVSLDNRLAALRATLGTARFPGADMALNTGENADFIKLIYAPIVASLESGAALQLSDADKQKLNKAVMASVTSVLGDYVKSDNLELTDAAKSGARVDYLYEALDQDELTKALAWTESQAARGNPAPGASGRLDADRETFGGLTSTDKPYTLREDLTDTQVLARLRMAINRDVEENGRAISVPVDAAIRSLFYDVYADRTKPGTTTSWANTLGDLGERIGWYVAHEFLHTLGLFDEYNADGQVMPQGTANTVMSSEYATALSDNQKKLVAIALNDTANMPKASEARALAAWYLQLAEARKDVDSQYVSAPGGDGASGGPFSNGDFAVSDPSDDAMGWTLSGVAQIDAGALTLSEGVPNDGRARQDFHLQPGEGTLTIRLRHNLQPDGEDGPQDAFEIALAAQTDTGTTPVSPIGLSNADATFNLQADGSVYTGAGVSVTGLTGTGMAWPGDQITVRIDLSSVPQDALLSLYLDMIGASALGSSVEVLSVSLDAAANRTPTARDDQASAIAGQPVTIDPLVNDTDPDGDPLTVTLQEAPANGTAELQSDGTIIYTAQAGFSGTDSFTYTVSDGEFSSAPATVTIQVGTTNAPPVAANDIASVTRDETVDIPVLANDSDAEDDTLTPVIATTPANGTVTVLANGQIRYVPTTGFTGTDSFTYTVSDGQQNSAPATVTVTVTDQPNEAPTAGADSATVTSGQSTVIAVLANDSDPEGATLTPRITTQPSHGTATVLADGTISYSGNGGYTGPDSFAYVVSDGMQDSAPATVSISVTAPPNGLPVSLADSATGPAFSPIVIDVLANDSDPDGDTLSVTITASPTNGTATVLPDGRINYVPNANFWGSDSLGYRANDGQDDGPETLVTITVEAPEIGINDPGAQTVAEGQTLSLALTAIAIQGQAAPVFSLETPTTGATLTEGGQLRFVGTDGPQDLTLDIQAEYADGRLATRTINVSVTNVAPSGAVTLPSGVRAEFPAQIGFAATDPGLDTITEWIIDWGDGRSGTVAGDESTATHTYDAEGDYIVTVTARDEDGTHQIGTRTLTVLPTTLRVETVDAAPDGIDINFNGAITTGPLNLYGPADPGPAPDVVVTAGDGTVIRGSLLVSGTDSLRFVPTEPLVAGDYSLRILSGSAALTGPMGDLDGDSDATPGGAYETSLTITGTGGVIAMADAIAGPGQSFVDPDGRTGLPIGFDSDGGVRSLVFTLLYDPAAIEVTDIQPEITGADVTTTDAAQGALTLMTLTVTFATPLAAGQHDVLRLFGRTLPGAAYGADGRVALNLVSINGAATDRPGHDALHIAAMAGDVTGDGSVDSADDVALDAIITGVRDGFAAFPRIDPTRLTTIARTDTGTETGGETPSTGTPSASGGSSGGSSGGGASFSSAPRIATGGSAVQLARTGVAIGGGGVDLDAILNFGPLDLEPMEPETTDRSEPEDDLAALCIFNQIDLPFELLFALRRMGGDTFLSDWCAFDLAALQDQFPDATMNQSAPADPEPAAEDTDIRNLPADKRLWCGEDLPREMAEALDALFRASRDGEPPAQWCVVATERDFRPTPRPVPVEAKTDTPAPDLEAAAQDNAVSASDFALFASAAALQASAQVKPRKPARKARPGDWGTDRIPAE